jgi:hypothetical protein
MLTPLRALLAAAVLFTHPAQEPAPPAAAALAEAGWEQAVADLYAVISGPVGQARNWEAFYAMFAEGANLMVSFPQPDGASRLLTMTPAEYVERSGALVVDSGFHEREIGRRAERFGNLVHVFSAYEGVMQAPAGERTIRGVNSLQLLRTEQGWKILNLAWEQATPQNEVPASRLAKPAGGSADAPR